MKQTSAAIAAQHEAVAALIDVIEQRYGLLTEAEARKSGLPIPEAAGLLALDSASGPRYPGFQFKDGAPRTDWQVLTQPLREAHWTSRDILLWFAAPTGWLDGRRPADLLDTHPQAVLHAVLTVKDGTAV